MRKASATTQSAVVKKVFFDEIMIKEYPLILGDNPAVYVLLQHDDGSRATHQYSDHSFACFCSLIGRVVHLSLLDGSRQKNLLLI